MINVSDFGARGDGRTDDRAAVQAALDRAHVIGAAVRFPAGRFVLSSATAPGNRILRTYPGQHLEGEGRDHTTLVVAKEVGDYVTVIGALDDSTGIGSWSLSRVTVDQSASTGAPLDVERMLEVPRMIVRLGDYSRGSTVTVTESAFVDTDNVNTLYLFADTVIVSDNVFTGVGGPVGTRTHDHSTVYLTATAPNGDQRVTGNSFTGIRSSGGATTAIETHGGRQDIHSNVISDYLRGMNLTGVASVPATTVSVRRNRLSRLAIGVQLWADKEVDPSTPTGLEVADIDQNQMTLDGAAWANLPGVVVPTTGILVNPLNTAAIGRVRIVRNRIDFVSITSSVTTDQYTAAISCRTVAVPRSVDILEVEGNRSTGAPVWIGQTCPVDARLVKHNSVR